MANPNSNQLYLLADHIKLSLLERQRAISLNLEPGAQDGHISRSLDSMRDGIEALEQGDDATARGQASTLRQQFDDLTSQFRGFPTSTTSTAQEPNDPSLISDFAHAKSTTPKSQTRQPQQQRPTPSSNRSSSLLKRSIHEPSPSRNKSVRFRDSDNDSSNRTYKDNASEEEDAEEAATRSALFPYKDDPSSQTTIDDPSQNLSNQQIHAHHSQVLAQQDEQLDRLGASIGRQRDLSIQIGDELDEQVQMLDEMDGHVDRHQGTLDGARKRLGDVARRARDNKQITVIVVLIVILVFLVLLLKT